MRYAGFLNALLIRSHSLKCVRAFTLVELMIITALIATLSAIGVPTYNGYIDRGRNTTAMVDIQEMGTRIASFQAENGRPPNTLAEAGLGSPLDPWGRPYRYIRIAGIVPEPAGVRKDHSVHPLNEDFDLFSVGKDGQSVAPLTADISWDDIVRANNGRFIGLGSEY
jgi:general secretion pathway protein G